MYVIINKISLTVWTILKNYFAFTIFHAILKITLIRVAFTDLFANSMRFAIHPISLIFITACLIWINSELGLNLVSNKMITISEIIQWSSDLFQLVLTDLASIKCFKWVTTVKDKNGKETWWNGLFLIRWVYIIKLIMFC